MKVAKVQTMTVAEWKKDYEARRRAKLDYIIRGRKQEVLDRW